MKDPFKLKDLIMKNLDMAKVMVDYKVRFSFNPMKVNEAQFKCPFHGKDNKPSARFYRDTQTCWCWVCQKSWDVVSFIMDKEQLYFKQAINFLIEKYKIDTSSISEDPEFAPPAAKQVSETDVEMLCLQRKIRDLRGKIPFERYKNICAALYMIKYNQCLGKNILDSIKKLDTKLNTVGT
jgi:hypothetical protein